MSNDPMSRLMKESLESLARFNASAWRWPERRATRRSSPTMSPPREAQSCRFAPIRSSWQTGTGRKDGTTMQHREGTRRIGRVGACLAFVSSILALTVATPAAAAEVDSASYGYYSIQLTGQEIPGGGDHNGQAYARLDLNSERETACFVISWRSIDGAVTALHLHAGHHGSAGPRWIDFFDDKHIAGTRNTVSGCVHVDGSHGMSPQDKIQAVIHDPSAFYLNVHSTEFPDGAIRGQLG
jgi:hypothetical protein